MGEWHARPRLALGTALFLLLGGGSLPLHSLPLDSLTVDSRAISSPSAAEPTNASRGGVLAPGSSAARVGAKATPTRTTPRWSGSVDVNDRAAVNSAYQGSYAPGLRTPTGWAGNESRCLAGNQGTASRTATLRAVNYARSLAGLAPVSFSTDLNSRSQQSALMMSANRALSHNPPTSWRCYTSSGGANAGKSNLALSYPSLTSAGLVSLYLEDAGSTNRAAGHRRWLLNPFSTVMGSGATQTANAITVVGPTSTSRPNPAVVSWPTAGYFPNTLEPTGRWSLSLGDRALSFRWASVRVWRNGTLVKTVKDPVEDGYAQPTLVWELSPDLARSGTFKVEVSNIRATATSTRYTRTYVVRMFTPAAT
jgi:uncharacterized protein YkwD